VYYFFIAYFERNFNFNGARSKAAHDIRCTSFSRKIMTLSKFLFPDENFYLVTVTKKIVMMQRK